MARQSDLLRDLYEASLEATVQQLRTIYRATRPREAPDACRPPGRGETAGGPTDLLYDLTRLTLQHYNQVATLSARYTDQLVERLRELARPPERAATAEPIRFRGVAGQDAVSRFIVQNPGRETVDVSFAAGEFRAAAGGAPFDVRVAFEPADGPGADGRRLEAGRSRTFALRVPLEPPFVAGQSYTTELFVLLHGRLVERVPLELWVDAPAGAVVRPAP
jgi:hypothetical protein